MKVEIELDESLAERLNVLARTRGESDYSAIIVESLKQYLEQFEQLDGDEREQRWRAALAAFGSISDEEAESMRRSVRELRENWH